MSVPLLLLHLMQQCDPVQSCLLCSLAGNLEDHSTACRHSQWIVDQAWVFRASRDSCSAPASTVNEIRAQACGRQMQQACLCACRASTCATTNPLPVWKQAWYAVTLVSASCNRQVSCRQHTCRWLSACACRRMLRRTGSSSPLPSKWFRTGPCCKAVSCQAAPGQRRRCRPKPRYRLSCST
jgi:hypothetical protein